MTNTRSRTRHKSIEARYYQFLEAHGYWQPETNDQLMREYLAYFKPGQRVLDVGCGDGTFMKTLIEHGCEAVGVDIDPLMVTQARRSGLIVVEANAVEYLQNSEVGPFDVIFSSNVIEHMPAEAVSALIDAAYDRLTSGGMLLLATPNPRSIIVQLSEFWRDATHVRPYDSQLLEFMLWDAGFEQIESGENPVSAWQPTFSDASKYLRENLLEFISKPHPVPSPQVNGEQETSNDSEVVAQPDETTDATSTEAAPITETDSLEDTEAVSAESASVVQAVEVAEAATETRATPESIDTPLLDEHDDNIAFEMEEQLNARLDEIYDGRLSYVEPTNRDYHIDEIIMTLAVLERELRQSQLITQTHIDILKHAQHRLYPAREIFVLGYKPEERLKVAYLTPYLPMERDTGGKIRSYHLLKAMADHHDVHLITVHGEPSREHIEETLELVAAYHHVPLNKPVPSWTDKYLTMQPSHVDLFISEHGFDRIGALLQSQSFDLIVVDEIVMAPYLEFVNATQRVLILHNIDHMRWMDNFRRLPWGRRKLLMRYEVYRLYHYLNGLLEKEWNQVLVCSQRDAGIVRQMQADTPVHVTVNGVDTDFYADIAEPDWDAPPTLVFVGSMFYEPNIDAMHYYFDEIHHRIVAAYPDLHVTIVGQHPARSIRELPERFPNVTVTGSVDDVRPYLEQAHVAIVPLRQGSGTSLKVAEGMAAGRPVVATSTGVRGLDLRPETDVMIADDPQLFADKVIHLIYDRNFYNKMRETARETVQRFNWEDLCEVWRRDVEKRLSTTRQGHD